MRYGVDGLGRPVWVPYKQGARKVMLFGDENEELIGGGVETTAKLVDDEWSKAGGDFWWEKRRYDSSEWVFQCLWVDSKSKSIIVVVSFPHVQYLDSLSRLLLQ
jgi:hypothetical protein